MQLLPKELHNKHIYLLVGNQLCLMAIKCGFQVHVTAGQ